MGYCPFSSLCRDKEFFVVIENVGPMSRHGFPCHDGPSDGCVFATKMQTIAVHVRAR